MVKDKLIAAKELIGDESKWVKGSFARDAANKTVNYADSTACRWCMLGAIWHCGVTPEETYLVKDIAGLGGQSLIDINDSCITKHSDVMAVMDKLILAAGD